MPFERIFIMEITPVQILILTCIERLGPFPISYGADDDIAFLLNHDLVRLSNPSDHATKDSICSTTFGQLALIKYLNL